MESVRFGSFSWLTCETFRHMFSIAKMAWHEIPRRSKLREDGSFRIRFIDFEAIAAGKCRCEKMMSKALLWWIYIYIKHDP